MMRSVALMNLIVPLLVAGGCAAQTSRPTDMPAEKTQPTASAFTCPDPEAQKACKSYEELVKAKDTSLPNGGYACFRKEKDEFFVVLFTNPIFLPPKATDHGAGYAHTYEDGVQNPEVVPAITFSGTWHQVGGSASFDSKKVVPYVLAVGARQGSVSIDEGQFNLDLKYRNRLGKTVNYNLTIQRSTGRFSESFQQEPEKVPFATNAGYCVKPGD